MPRQQPLSNFKIRLRAYSQLTSQFGLHLFFHNGQINLLKMKFLPSKLWFCNNSLLLYFATVTTVLTIRSCNLLPEVYIELLGGHGDQEIPGTVQLELYVFPVKPFFLAAMSATEPTKRPGCVCVWYRQRQMLFWVQFGVQAVLYRQEIKILWKTCYNINRYRRLWLI